MNSDIATIEKYLRCNEHFRSNVDRFKAAFLKYYGEEKREEIESAFSKAIFIAFQTPGAIKTSVNKIKELITQEIFKKRIPEGSIFTADDLSGTYLFEYSNIMPINYYAEFLRDFRLSEEGRHKEFVDRAYKSIVGFLPEMTREELETMMMSGQILDKYNSINPWLKDRMLYFIDSTTEKEQYAEEFEKIKGLLDKIDPNMTVDTFAEYFDDPRIQFLNQVAQSFPQMMQEYTDTLKGYQGIINGVEEDEKRKQSIYSKQYQMLIKYCLDLIPEDKRKGLAEFLNDYEKKYLLDRYIISTFGFSIDSPGCLEAFTSNADELLTRPEKDWKTDNIQRDRVKYFKSLGVDLGDDYSVYANSEEARKIWPSCERVDKFLELKKDLANKANIEYYTGTSFYRQIRAEIDAHHFLDKEDSFNAGLFTNPGTFVNPNIVQTEHGYDTFSLVVVSCEHNNGMVDHNVVHELNHLFELSLMSVDGNKYIGLCGWDSLEGQINQTSVDEVNTLENSREKRPYELFNEIINELIAQEICEVMRADGTYVFDTVENARDKNTTSYESTFFLVRDFYAEFKDKIIASRRGGRIDIIWDEVGKENFDALNDLFRIFNENFAGFAYYNLLSDLKDKKDTPKTRVYYELVAKRDEILEKMRSYSMSKGDIPLEETAESTMKM